MKKFILFLIAFIGISIATTAQSGKTASFGTSYYVEYTGVAADSCVNGAPWNKEFTLNKEDGVFYQMQIKLSDQVAAAGAIVKIQGKVHANDAYTDIDTKRWYGGGTDSTINLVNISTKSYYRYLNVLVTQTATEAKISNLKISLKK